MGQDYQVFLAQQAFTNVSERNLLSPMRDHDKSPPHHDFLYIVSHDMIHIIINLHLSRSEGLPSCVAPENYHLKNGELTRFVV